jgi:6-phosphogluconolactonase
MGGMARISRRVILAAAPLVPLAPYLTRSLFGQHPSHHMAKLYIGTYTHDMGVAGKADGIYVAEWDAATGSANLLQLAIKSADPSFLAAPPSRDALYAVNEGEDYPQPHGGKGGSVSAFRRDPASGKLTEQNIVPSGGSGPCYITVDRAGRAAFVANYSNGTLASFRITPKGLEGPVTVFVSHGSGPNKERQKGPHLHCTTLSPDERFLLVSDLGTDHIWIFHVDPKTAELKETGTPWQAKPGSGPRHTHFHPNGKWVYSINEMASTIDVLAWDAKNGTLKGLSEVPLRAPAYTGKSDAAELAIDRRGRFLYASNRSEDVLVVFAIDAASGALTLVQRIGCGGKNPRDFALDPSETWLVVSNQDTQNIAVFARDPHSGKLTATDRSYHVGAPVAVLFV